MANETWWFSMGESMDNQWIAYGLDHWNLLCFLWDDTNMVDFHTVEWFNWLVKSWGSFDGDSWRVKLVKPWNYDMKPGLLKFIDCFWWFIVIDDDLNDYVWWFMMIYMIIYMIIWFKQIHVGLFWWWTKNSSHMIDAYIYIYTFCSLHLKSWWSQLRFGWSHFDGLNPCNHQFPPSKLP